MKHKENDIIFESIMLLKSFGEVIKHSSDLCTENKNTMLNLITNNIKSLDKMIDRIN